jgi:hypothetical protein
VGFAKGYSYLAPALRAAKQPVPVDPCAAMTEAELAKAAGLTQEQAANVKASIEKGCARTEQVVALVPIELLRRLCSRDRRFSGIAPSRS